MYPSVEIINFIIYYTLIWNQLINEKNNYNVYKKYYIEFKYLLKLVRKIRVV